MIHWTKKKYAEELKKGYWDLEPHFYYYCQLKLYKLSRIFILEKMGPEEIKSAMYGMFVCEGKLIINGFYDNFNLISKIVSDITKCNLVKFKAKERRKNDRL